MRLDASQWLGRLDDARDLALAGEAEGIHQVRVSLRRLRVWLDFSKGTKALDAELKWACGALALVRDLDVFEAVLSADARETLRVEAEDEAVAAMESERWRALRAALSEVKPPKQKRAKKGLKRLERRLAQLKVQPGDGESLHRLRRTLRRVRYAREWLGKDTKAHAQTQEELGALCDLLALERLALERQAEVPTVLREGILRGFSLLERR
ncbi:MAG TPA: CHAD domain-containing protein [Archangium sp.]